ncbi:PQQ-binding-like beta-propeller repeat protein, partial [bacterium]|nr:PQQ-binding-like beta-propeller repeat protein [bacterium]
VPVFQNRKPTEYKRNYAFPPAKGPLDSFILALDPKTGRDLWKHVRPTDATEESTEGYFTLVPFECGGRSEVVLAAGECVTGHDAATGKELWRWWFQPADRHVWQRIVTSVVPGDGLVYASRPRHRPLFAIRGGGNGVLKDDAVAWTFDGPTPDAATPLLYQGRLYVVDGAKTKNMTCLDPKTGAKKWQGWLGGRQVYRASPTGADGKIYCMNKSGDVVVLAAGDAFKVLHRVKMGGAPARASIAVGAGSLFIRTAKALHCIREGAKLAR